jgi:hypothetical protein
MPDILPIRLALLLSGWAQDLASSNGEALRAVRWRQHDRGLHEVLGPGNAYDQGRMESRVPTHHRTH